MTSAAVKTAMRRGTWLVRASAESKPESPEIGLTIQFTASLDHRSPHRLGVTLVTATSVIPAALAWSSIAAARRSAASALRNGPATRAWPL